MQQNSNGIYTYIGEVYQNGAFHGQGTLTYPSGKPVRATFTNNQLQIKADLANEDNKLGIVIDCSLLTQEQFNKHIESLLQAMELNDGDTIAITHHQLKLTNKTDNNIAKLLRCKNITLQWLSCGDINTAQSIQNLTEAGIKVVYVPDGQSAIVVKDEDGNEYFVGVDEEGKLVLPAVHKANDDDQIVTEDTEEHKASCGKIFPTKNKKFFDTLNQDKAKNASGNGYKQSLSDYVKNTITVSILIQKKRLNKSPD